jgi:probable rRNA maturation factor
MNPAMNAVDVIIEDEDWARLDDLRALASDAVKAARKAMGEAELRPGAAAILFTDDDAMADLNQRFRQKDGPTNVLSFPAAESSENHLGDIALGWGVCAREAEAAGKSCEDHARHLVIHGYLHLQGYDHQSDEEAEVMEAIEVRALKRLGVADPYSEERLAAETGR